jgi:hypothetical protein
MTTLKSITRSCLVIVAALLLWNGNADAGRRRIVVLDFEGPKAEKFHDDLVKLIKRNHTVLSVDKWNELADELDAGKITEKNVKKLAKKLRLDGVVTGKIEKRRDEYIIRLKLRAGTTGELIGASVQTKAEGPRLDAQAQRDIKDELIAAIEELDANRDDEEEEEEEEEEEDDGDRGGFVKKRKMAEEEEEEEDPRAAKKRKAEAEKRRKEEERLAKEEEAKRRKEEERLAKEEEKRKKDDAKRKKADDEASASRRARADEEEEEEEEEEPPKRRASEEEEEEEEEEEGSSRRKKRVASSDDDDGGSIEDGGEVDSGEGRDLSAAGRAMDAVVGMSFTARTLKFSYQSDLAKPPPGYKQSIPVAGAIIDATLYPMAFSKGSKGLVRGIGVNVLYDRVLVINSQKKYSDPMGMQRVADLTTSESRWALGAVFRYPMGKILVGGSLSYGKQQFSIAQTLPNNDPTDIPSVSYTFISPAGFVKYPVTPKITANGELAFLGVTNTGQIQASGATGYGAATVTGFELEAGADYMVKKNIFARASLRYQTFGFTFKGDPTSQSNIRDTDMTDKDVTGARDSYVGGTVTVGYIY